MSISLEKKVSLVKDILAKRNVPENIVVAVKLCIDVSGSIAGYFRDGTIQELTDRLIPVAMRFDDNKSIEAYAFSDRAKRASDITMADVGTYINRFQKDVAGVLWGGTSYSSALQLVMDDTAPSGGFFGFGKKKAAPSYLMFVTDGDSFDEAQSEKLISSLGKCDTYVQLIGVGRGSRFTFLNRMADKYDHVGFVTFPDLDRTTDEEMYEALLGEEFCTWIKAR